ncbi:MAG TPA: hypothetical protein VLA20_05110 [Vicinamibacterales bacterium]|nr:hypothetical protein [Vicinamibacterales bacterium]
MALLLLLVALAGVAGLAGVSLSAAREARLQTAVTVAAIQKIEQLRSLTWAFDQGVAASDVWTNLSVVPARSDGRGLSVSPSGVLAKDTSGYVDYLDGRGAWLAAGPGVPPGAVYARRWSVEALGDDPAHTLVLRVFVTPLTRDGQAGAFIHGNFPGHALLVTLLTRKAR